MNTARATFEAIAAVNLDAVPVMSQDRHIDRKQQAKLARQLFKQLGLKGISVTTPMHSMASMVDIRVPHEDHPGWAGFEQWQHSSYSDMPPDVPAKQAAARRWQANQQIGVILAKAFPQHDDRGDLATDYHDSCWFIQ